MFRSSGKSIQLTPFRRLVTDLMYFSQQVPSVAADRRMDLSDVAEARRRCPVRISWVTLFAKAYAIAARNYPELRQSYLKFPRPRLYEHPYHIATINIERHTEIEPIVLYCLIRSPENRSLEEIEGIIRHHKEAPLNELRSYKRSVAMSHIPWPFRRWFWWASLNVFGRRRCQNFGTFCVSSVSAQGAGLQRLIPLLTSTIHYGMLDEHSRLNVLLSWDHRVLDGARIAAVLVDLEKTLKRDIVQELSSYRLAKVA